MYESDFLAYTHSITKIAYTLRHVRVRTCTYILKIVSLIQNYTSLRQQRSHERLTDLIFSYVIVLCKLHLFLCFIFFDKYQVKAQNTSGAHTKYFDGGVKSGICGKKK